MRLLRRVAAVVLVLLVVGVLGGATYFADQLTAVPDYRPFERDNEVLAADDTTVTLRDEGFLASTAGDGSPAVWGLQLPQRRHVELTEVLARDEAAGTVTWGWTDATGIGPQPGEPVRVDEFVHAGDPTTVDLPYAVADVDGPLGSLPTWSVPAVGEPVGTVVFVHGRGSTREEALRFLPTLVDAGWDVVVPTYRGDAATVDGAPEWPDQRVRFGVGAWADLEAVVADASAPGGVLADHGDRPLVLMGVSMGGGLVGQLLDRSPLADEVDGVVLDSPVLSLDDLLVLQGELNGVPPALRPVLLPVVQWIGDLRHGLSSASLEQVADDATFDLPVLLVHGDDDAFVPVEGSLRFVGARDPAHDPARPAGPTLHEVPDDVAPLTFLRVPGAGHVRTWNVAAARYAQVLERFLADVAERPVRPGPEHPVGS